MRSWVLPVVCSHTSTCWDDRQLTLRYAPYGVPRWQRWLFGTLTFGAVKRIIIARLGVSAEAAERARQQCWEVFDAVAKRIDDGRPYLLGKAFTAADLTFAALSAPLVLPANYGVPMPPDHELSDAFRTDADAFRAHPAGAFALRLYHEQRYAIVSTQRCDG